MLKKKKNVFIKQKKYDCVSSINFTFKCKFVKWNFWWMLLRNSYVIIKIKNLEKVQRIQLNNEFKMFTLTAWETNLKITSPLPNQIQNQNIQFLGE